MIDVDRAIKKAHKILNDKYTSDMISILNDKTGFLDNLNREREQQVYKKSGKAMRKVASLPMEVDAFFIKVYGPDYYKDPDFFTKHYTEWSVQRYTGR